MGLTAKKNDSLVQVLLDDIRIDGGTQPRVEVNQQTVDEYAEKLDTLPPPDVFFDGANYWLADGFHRYHAHRKKKRGVISCRKHIGTVRDAILFAIVANSENPLQLTPQDRRHICRMLLSDEEWGKWSDKDIAAQGRVGRGLVAAVRAEMKEEERERKKKEKAARAAAEEKAAKEAEAKAAAERAKAREGWVRPGKQDPPKTEPHLPAQASEEMEPEEEDVRVYRTKHGTVAQMRVGKIGKGRSRHIIRVETDLDVLAEIDKQLPRSFKKSARQGIRRGWTEEQGVEYLRKIWRSLLAGEG